MPRIHLHWLLHGLLVLALFFSAVTGAWAAVHGVVPDEAAGHCEHMTADAGDSTAQPSMPDCCQHHDQCGGCCQLGSSSPGFICAIHQDALALLYQLRPNRVLSPDGEHPAFDIRPPIQAL